MHRSALVVVAVLVALGSSLLAACGGPSAAPLPANQPPAAAPASASAAAPDDGGARAFVEALYRAHDPNAAAGDAPWLGDRCPRHFTARLCALIEADIREAAGEVPTLNGDPLWNGQDFLITDLGFETRAAEGGSAVVAVRFHNQGEPREVDAILVRTDAGWRIDDLRYGGAGGGTLSGILSGSR